MNFLNSELLTEEYLKKAGKTIIALAVIELLLSILVLFFTPFGIEVIIYVLAFTLISAGITKTVYTFKHEMSTGKMILSYVVSFLYIVAGISSFFEPYITFVYLALMIGFLLIFQGFALLFSASASPAKGWQIFNGIITLILGGAIVINYPASVFLVALFIGLSLLSNAITLFVAYFATKKYAKTMSEQSEDTSTETVSEESTEEQYEIVSEETTVEQSETVSEESTEANSDEQPK